MSAVAWFTEISREDVSLAGGKGANLGELTRAGIPVPPGFVVTTRAYLGFLERNALSTEIARRLERVEPSDLEALGAVSNEVRSMIGGAPVPEDTAEEIRHLYERMGGGPVAVRSSATAEDLKDTSFAGQQATFLNVVGGDAVVDAVRGCWASLFTPQAIAYRARNGFDHASVAIAVPVQSMVQAERSGVMFTLHPVTGSPDQLVIEAVYGLGEALVSGAVSPDTYIVQKGTYAVVERTTAEQDEGLVFRASGSGVEWRPVPVEAGRAPKLTDDEIAVLAKLGARIEEHYGSPQDIEWAMVGEEVAILQARPVTTL